MCLTYDSLSSSTGRRSEEEFSLIESPEFRYSHTKVKKQNNLNPFELYLLRFLWRILIIILYFYTDVTFTSLQLSGKT